MSDQSSQSATTASPIELVDAYVTAWNTRDGDAVVAALAPGATFVNSSLPGPVSGDELAGYVNGLATAFPDFEFTSKSYGCNGEAFLRWTLRGTYTGTFSGVPGPTGASFELRGVSFFRFGPEGITSDEVVFDQMDLLQQLGVAVQLSIAE